MRTHSGGERIGKAGYYIYSEVIDGKRPLSPEGKLVYKLKENSIGLIID